MNIKLDSKKNIQIEFKNVSLNLSQEKDGNLNLVVEDASVDSFTVDKPGEYELKGVGITALPSQAETLKGIFGISVSFGGYNMILVSDENVKIDALNESTEWDIAFPLYETDIKKLETKFEPKRIIVVDEKYLTKDAAKAVTKFTIEETKIKKLKDEKSDAENKSEIVYIN